MDIIRFSITNPVKVSVGVLLLVLFGLIALGTIPVQLTPDVEQPIVRVTTQWVGRSPEEVEKQIVEPQEDVLKDVSGLSKMTAVAYQGRAEIELEFTIGTNIKNARQEVSDSLREVPEYPDDADEPVIDTGEGGAESPIAWLILQSRDRNFDVQTLGDAAEDRIKPYLERVTGVSEVRVYGGRERQVHVEVDPNKLAQRSITFNELRDALRLENVNISAGELSEGQYDRRVRTVGEYTELDQVRNTIVAYGEGGPIRISDIAQVKLDYEKRRGFVRAKGELSLALPVYRETGANVIAVMEELKERIAAVNEDLLPVVAEQVRLDRGLDEAPQLQLVQVYDETGYIYDALSLVQSNLFIGGTFAILSLLVFLRSVRPTGVVAMAIPVSVIGTFVAMAAFGRNLNVISLAGLAFAVGMVVDNGIVVLENIDRHLGMGKRPQRAAYDAAKEVWGAILASTLTTLAVFLPVLTIQEEAGQLFRDISLAICAAVALSLIVSITVIPTASARFLKPHSEPRLRITRAGRSLFGLAPRLAQWGRGYADLIYRLTSPDKFGYVARVGIVAGFTIASLVGAAILMPPADYLPRGNQNLVFGMVLTPPGYNIEQNEFIAERVESIVKPYWEADTYADLQDVPPVVHPFTQQPIADVPPVDNFFFVTFFGGVIGGATSADPQNVAPVGDLLTAAFNSIPGSFGFAQQTSLFGRGFGGTRSIAVEVVGTNLDHVLASGAALQGALQQKYGYAQVQPDPNNFDLPGPELRVEIDRVRAADLGIDVASLGLGVQALVDGMNVGDFRLRGDAIDILLKRDESVKLMPEDLASIPVAYTDGQGRKGQVPLSAVADIQRTSSPQQIRRIEELRAVTLNVTPPDNVPLEVASAEIDALVEQMREQGQIAREVEVDLAGSASKLVEVRAALLGQWYGTDTWQDFFRSLQSLGLSRIFLALLVTYLLMAALFESFLYPFVIMFAVPLATVGGFLGLAFVHDGWWMENWPLIGGWLYGKLGPAGLNLINPAQQLDTLTMLGFIILIGVVVNNAILIVHQALNFMRGLGEGEGDTTGVMAPREAIRESVRTRIRPILMTTTTSVAGMLPLVLMAGSGSELYRGLGSVVVGGLIVATLFTLVVVPLLFSLVLDVKRVLVGSVEEEAPDLKLGAPAPA